MRITWPDSFAARVAELQRGVAAGDRLARKRLAALRALLEALRELSAKPDDESATFKRVRQARRRELWRVAHPFDPDVAVRVIVWFPSDTEVVVALLSFDKAKLGDVWYDRAATEGQSLRSMDPAALAVAGGRMSNSEESENRDPRDMDVTGEVAFVDATDAVDELLANPELADESRAIRERMREADRVHAMTLAMVRHAAGLTQVELARALNVSQGAVARTEARGDMLLSTLRAYLEAAGARAVLLVELADGTMAQISLDEASAA